MGHAGMKYSLPSRDLIADSVEIVAQAHALDGLVLVVNCDKIVPGMLMAAARLDIPSVIISGGPMLAGSFDGKDGGTGGGLRSRGQAQRRENDGRGPGAPGMQRLPGPGLVRRAFHGQHDELPLRGAGAGAARKRDHPGRVC